MADVNTQAGDDEDDELANFLSGDVLSADFKTKEQLREEEAARAAAEWEAEQRRQFEADQAAAREKNKHLLSLAEERRLAEEREAAEKQRLREEEKARLAAQRAAEREAARLAAMEKKRAFDEVADESGDDGGGYLSAAERR